MVSVLTPVARNFPNKGHTPNHVLMIVSHKHEFIFLKTRKTASSSMELALSQLLGPDDIITPARPEIDDLRDVGIGGQNSRLTDHPDVPKQTLLQKFLCRPERYYHPTVGYYEHMPAWRVKTYLGDEIWQRYFKFAFERNPWDRQVSNYHYKNRAKGSDDIPSFDEFLALGPKSYVDNWDVYTIDNAIAVDFVGKFETIDKSFANILSRLNVDGLSLPTVNAYGKEREREQILPRLLHRRDARLCGRFGAQRNRFF